MERAFGFLLLFALDVVVIYLIIVNFIFDIKYRKITISSYILDIAKNVKSVKYLDNNVEPLITGQISEDNSEFLKYLFSKNKTKIINKMFTFDNGEYMVKRGLYNLIELTSLSITVTKTLSMFKILYLMRYQEFKELYSLSNKLKLEITGELERMVAQSKLANWEEY